MAEKKNHDRRRRTIGPATWQRLLSAGYDVRLVQDRTGEDIRAGKVMSSQCMFDIA